MADSNLQQDQQWMPIPLYDTDTPRVMVAGAYHGRRYVNGWPRIVRDPVLGQVLSARFTKRPGLRRNSTTDFTPTIVSYGNAGKMFCLANIAMTTVDDVCVAAFFDATASKIYIIQYRPNAKTTVKIGELTSCTSSDYIFLTEFMQNVGGTYPASGALTPGVLISYQKGDRSVGAGYYAVTTSSVFTSSSLTTISSGSFPSNLGTPKVITGQFVQMNGYIYIMTMEGTIYCSGGTAGTLYDCTLWNTNAITVASMNPDWGQGVLRYKNMILALGTDSIEFFADGSLPVPNSPLVRVDQAYCAVGVVNPKMAIQVEDNVYWVASGKAGVVGVYRMDGYQPEKLTTLHEDDALRFAFAAQTIGNVTSLELLVIHGQKHLAVNGMYYRTMLYYGGYSLATETFAVTPTTSECNPYISCYSIEDKVWWGLSLGNDLASGSIGTSYIKATTNPLARGTNPVWQQYIFVVNTTTASSNATMEPTLLKTWAGNSSPAEQYNDDYSTGIGDDPVNVVIQFPEAWNVTERRKRINRLALRIPKLVQQSTDTTTDYTLYFASIPRESDSPESVAADSTALVSGTYWHTLTVPGTDGRVAFNNLGLSRSWQFLVYCKMNAPFYLDGLDIFYTQHTS